MLATLLRLFRCTKQFTTCTALSVNGVFRTGDNCAALLLRLWLLRSATDLLQRHPAVRRAVPDGIHSSRCSVQLPPDGRRPQLRRGAVRHHWQPRQRALHILQLANTSHIRKRSCDSAA